MEDAIVAAVEITGQDCSPGELPKRKNGTRCLLHRRPLNVIAEALEGEVVGKDIAGRHDGVAQIF